MMKVMVASLDMIQINIVSLETYFSFMWRSLFNNFLIWARLRPLNEPWNYFPLFGENLYIMNNKFFSASKAKLRRKKVREEDLRIVEGDTKEILTEKFLLLRDAYDKLKDENTLLEYENESLKDYQDEREEEVNNKIKYP